MSDIAPIGRPHLPSLNSATRSTYSESLTPSTPRGSDRVELSTHAQLLSKLGSLPDVRQDVVDRVRAAIGKDNYDSPDKIDQILDEMLADLADMD